MAIDPGHFRPMPANFEPPRPGTMPPRVPVVTIGLNDIEISQAQRRSEAPGHLVGGRYNRDLDSARKRGTAKSAAIRNTTQEQAA